MKLLYLTLARLPNDQAHGIQIVETVSALSGEGHEVELMHALPPKHSSDRHTHPIQAFYGVAGSFTTVPLWVPDIAPGTTIGYRIRMILFGVRAFFAVVLRSRETYIYSREPFPLLLLSWFGFKTCYELHDFPGHSIQLTKPMVRAATKVIATNSWTKEKCITACGISSEKIIVAPNGVALEQFAEAQPFLLREELSLPPSSNLAVYTGHLYAWKGVEVLVEALTLLPDSWHVVVVGGSNEEIEVFQKKHAHPRLHLLGQKPHTEIPGLLKAANVLVLPNVPANQHSEFSTSPIKLFEYLASGRPVVASDLPAIRDVVSEQEVWFTEAGSAKNLAETIKLVAESHQEAAEKCEQGLLLARKFSWEARAQKIAAFLSTR